MSLPYQESLISRAKELRKSPTKQERHLWYDYLRAYPVRFQRQKVIGYYIVDFYCHQARLVIELDGSQHYSDNGLAYDRDRDNALAQYDLFVLRFANNDVDRNFRGVCDEIDRVVQQRVGK